MLGTIVLCMGSFLAVYTYISPLLTERAGIPAGAVPMVLTGYGVGALLGTMAGGRTGDRRPLATLVTAAVTTTLVLLLLVPLSTSPVATVVLVTLMAVTDFGATPVHGALVVRFARPRRRCPRGRRRSSTRRWTGPFRRSSAAGHRGRGVLAQYVGDGGVGEFGQQGAA